jgi:hypothetical protein
MPEMGGFHLSLKRETQQLGFGFRTHVEYVDITGTMSQNTNGSFFPPKLVLGNRTEGRRQSVYRLVLSSICPPRGVPRSPP